MPGPLDWAAARAASIAARASLLSDRSRGTTMPGSTTPSSRGSTGSVRVSLMLSSKSVVCTQRKLSHTHSRKRSMILFPQQRSLSAIMAAARDHDGQCGGKDRLANEILCDGRGLRAHDAWVLNATRA